PLFPLWLLIVRARSHSSIAASGSPRRYEAEGYGLLRLGECRSERPSCHIAGDEAAKRKAPTPEAWGLRWIPEALTSPASPTVQSTRFQRRWQCPALR